MKPIAAPSSSANIFHKTFFYVFLIVSFETLLFIPSRNIELVTKLSSFNSLLLGSIFFLAFAAIFLASDYWLSTRARHTIRNINQSLASINPSSWLMVIIGIGTLLRIGWMWVFPPIQDSDQAVYVELAHTIAAGYEYYIGGTYSIWPPGYPFFLVPFIKIFKTSAWVPAIANFVLFYISIIALYYLAKNMFDDTTAKISSLLFILWPNYLAGTGLAIKELLILATIVSSCLVYYTASIKNHDKYHWLLFLISGFFAGAATLTQPYYLLIPFAYLGFELTNKTKLYTIIPRLLLVIIGMSIVITPWAVRNYKVHNDIVLVTTTGGLGLLIGNHDKATGKYMDISKLNLLPKDYDKNSEPLRSKIAYEIAIHWIMDNPYKFANLVWKRQMIFLGDASTNIFEALKRALNINDFRYISIKGIANFYWLILWGLIILVLFKMLRQKKVMSPQAILLCLYILLPLSVHTIYQSNEKSNMPVTGFIIILASTYFSRFKSH